MIKKSAAYLIGLSLLAAPLSAFGQTADNTAQIAALLQQIQQLTALIAQLKAAKEMASSSVTSASANTSCLALTHHMLLGSHDAETGGEVSTLQGFLIAKGYLVVDGGPTGYYGTMTMQALGNWQVAAGIVSSASDSAYGFVGPKTRAALDCSGAAPLGNLYSATNPNPAGNWGGTDNSNTTQSSTNATANTSNTSAQTSTDSSVSGSTATSDTGSSLQLIAPADAEVIHQGGSYSIKWSATSDMIAANPNVDIILVGMSNDLCDPFGCGYVIPNHLFALLTGTSIAHAASQITIASNVSLSTGSYVWSVPNGIASQVDTKNGLYQIFFVKSGTNTEVLPYTNGTFYIR